MFSYVDLVDFDGSLSTRLAGAEQPAPRAVADQTRRHMPGHGSIRIPRAHANVTPMESVDSNIHSG